MIPPAAVIGIDLGTTACKVTVIAENGSVDTTTSPAYVIDAPRIGWAEQDPEHWWAAVRDTVHRATADRFEVRSEVVLGFTGQMHSFVMLDDAGHALRPAVLWSDRRAVRESGEVAAAVPSFRAITGNPPLPAFTLPQLMWTRRHEPEAFDRCRSILVAKDYLRFRATGCRATDWTDASGTGMLDAVTRIWSREILDALEIDGELLPPVHSPLDSGGAAEALLPGSTTAIGVGDQFAEALSAGVLDEGDLAVSLGTSATILGVTDRPVDGAFVHAPADRWLRLESLHAGGKSLEWFANAFLGGSVAEALSLAEKSLPGSRGVLFLPFLLGDRRALGAGAPAGFVGLTLSTTIEDMARAVIEGVAFELRRMHDSAEWTAGAHPMVIKGGGARSRLWLETLGAVFGRSYRRSMQGASMGAAIIAGVSAGRWADFGEGVGELDEATQPSASLLAPLQDRYVDYAEAVARLQS